MSSLPKRAFLDTSVMADALLKKGDQGRTARDAIAKFDDTALPVYAIKEFKAGVLRNYIYLHNKVVVAKTWADAVDAVAKLTATPHKAKLSTALRAVTEFEGSISKQLPADWSKRYPGLSVGEVMKREGQIWLKTVILLAWRNRRKLTKQIICPLPCYAEKDPTVSQNGTILDTPVKCENDDCCLREPFAEKKKDLSALIAACDAMPPKPETAKRRAVLRQLERIPGRPLDDAECRRLGDAVFVLQCPKDAVILTTNIKDHKPLAESIGVAVLAPAEVV